MNKRLLLGLLAAGLLAVGCGKGKVKTSDGKITRNDTKVMDAYGKLSMSDEYDAAKDKLTKELGDPDKADGDTLYWFGIKPKDSWGPEQCFQIELKQNERSAGPTDAAKCGLKK